MNTLQNIGLLLLIIAVVIIGVFLAWQVVAFFFFDGPFDRALIAAILAIGGSSSRGSR